MNKFSEFAKSQDIRLDGEKTNIRDVFNRNIGILGYRIMKSRAVRDKEVLEIQFVFLGEDYKRVLFTNSEVLMRQMQDYEALIPFEAKIIKAGSYYTLTQEDEDEGLPKKSEH